MYIYRKEAEGPFRTRRDGMEKMLVYGSRVLRKTKEIVLRPGVFGGLLGAVNLAVLATLSWFAYDHWSDTSVWTRRNLSIATQRVEVTIPGVNKSGIVVRKTVCMIGYSPPIPHLFQQRNNSAIPQPLASKKPYGCYIVVWTPKVGELRSCFFVISLCGIGAE